MVTVKYHALPDRVIVTRGREKLYGFKIKDQQQEIRNLFATEASRHGHANDFFMKTQMDYDGYNK